MRSIPTPVRLAKWPSTLSKPGGDRSLRSPGDTRGGSVGGGQEGRDKHHDYPFRCSRRAAHRHLSLGDRVALGALSTSQVLAEGRDSRLRILHRRRHARTGLGFGRLHLQIRYRYHHLNMEPVLICSLQKRREAVRVPETESRAMEPLHAARSTAGLGGCDQLVQFRHSAVGCVAALQNA